MCIRDRYMGELLREERDLEERLQSEAIEDWVLQNRDILIKYFKKEEPPTREELIEFLNKDYERVRMEHEQSQTSRLKEMTQEEDYRQVLEERKKALLQRYFPEPASGDVDIKQLILNPVSYTHLTLPTIYSV
eukprot:TRINITY_DN6598_c0_g1_i4.p1 TRINITY_DN6598_c0_g1~~TRINITY_DN6598_c0_g1_i4.p1  ORF type:complete len:149 (-),score=60.03 TRINITY_DN6598_c0_g1_i4:36-434(-)